ncbi:MAG TPA: PIG-L family deacetylase [Flavobacterium sp.]|nr:PIG-L family deacetylase [Flavobacterium sp.]
MRFNLLFVFICLSVFAQQPKTYTSNQIYHEIEKLNFLGAVLYVAAHPDDENTKLISYFSNQLHANTAYISLTRGDGGQNLIGPEMGELLGIIRTQELLNARRIDGGKQFFTRAYDFGFSKLPDETFEIWDKQQVLDDLVQVIENFRPDIIVNRFDHRTPGTTHGHHTASAMLSLEAFDKIKNQKNAPQRLLYNTSPWSFPSQEAFEKADKTNHLWVEANVFYPTLGKSNNEIAAQSRSQHKCQGFGTTGNRSSENEYLEVIRGKIPKNNKDIFEGINTNWSRIPEGKAIAAILEKIEKNFNFENPSIHIKELTKAYALIQNIEDNYWRTQKAAHIKEIIAACAGLYLEAISDTENTTKSTPFTLKLEATNRSKAAIALKEVKFFDQKIIKNQPLFTNTPVYDIQENILVTETIPYSNPYWLRQQKTKGMFVVEDKNLRNLAETNDDFPVVFVLDVEGTTIEYTKNIAYKLNTPEDGETYRPFVVLPDVVVSFVNVVVVFADTAPKEVSVKVKALQENVHGSVTIDVPEGWSISPKEIPFDIRFKSAETLVKFTLIPPANPDNASLKAIAVIDGKSFDQSLVEIDYKHIPKQSILITAEAKATRIDLKKSKQNIGYVMGASDQIPQGLLQIGYDVTLVPVHELTAERLTNFETLLIGIRAYNTTPELRLKGQIINDYVADGGTVIMQYLTTDYRGKTTDLSGFAPYQLKIGRERVTNEEAKISFINSQHSVLTKPNKISAKDFDNWIQERGLYFAAEWSPEYESVFRMNDTGEKPKDGSLLIAKFGKGHFVYTGISFFRQIPSGIDGAYRLLVNLIEL